MTSPIPVIDLELATGPEAPADVLEQVRTAIHEIGIVQVVNHGFPLDLLTDFDRRVGRLLDLPRDEKIALASPTAHPYRGWRQWPDDFGRLELERYSIGQFETPEAARAAGVPEEYAVLYADANVWPGDDPGLRETAYAYHDAAVRVAERALRLYATVLGLDQDTFTAGTQPPYTTFVVNNYPRWIYPDVPDDEKLLLLEHADGSAVTVLAQTSQYEGLQIQLRDGTWVPVPVIPDALQVFSGSLLSRWTDGRLRAVRHRVVAGGTATRRSSAVFYHPNLDTVIEPLPGFVGPEGTDYEPVLLWDQVKEAVDDYLKVFGRPDQIRARREGRPYVAELHETSAGR